jgi:hypothetical protein
MRALEQQGRGVLLYRPGTADQGHGRISARILADLRVGSVRLLDDDLGRRRELERGGVRIALPDRMAMA